MTKTIFSVLAILCLTSCNSGQAIREKPQPDTTSNVASIKIPNTTTSDTTQMVTIAPNTSDTSKTKQSFMLMKVASTSIH
jgi:hypothetical protein